MMYTIKPANGEFHEKISVYLQQVFLLSGLLLVSILTKSDLGCSVVLAVRSL